MVNSLACSVALVYDLVSDILLTYYSYYSFFEKTNRKYN